MNMNTFVRITFATFLFSVTLSFLNAQTPLPYYTGFDNATEQAGWVEYDLGVTSTYPWEFYNSSAYSAPTCLRRDYPVGGTQVTDGWFVSLLLIFLEAEQSTRYGTLLQVLEHQ